MAPTRDVRARRRVILTRRARVRQGTRGVAGAARRPCRNVDTARESPADQWLSERLRRISTSLPTQSVGKCRDAHVVQRGSTAWHRDANCGEAVHNAARLTQRLHHTCQSPSDQGLSVAVRRISTSLPTFSVEKCGWRSCGAVSRCAAVHGVRMPIGATFWNDGSCCFAMAADRNVTVDHSIASSKYVGLLASARRSWVGMNCRFNEFGIAELDGARCRG